MAEEPPSLAIAAETDPADLEKERAKRELGWDTRALAANLLRVIRGAGRPSELPQQIINLGEAILETHKSVRAWAIWSAIEDTLHSGVPDYWDAPESVRYETTIVKGALQLVASKLVHQNAQEAAGGREIDEGIRELDQRRERMRRAEEAVARKLTQRKKAKKPKPRTAAKSAAPEPTPASPEPEPERSASTAEFMKTRQRELHSDRA